MARIKKMWLKLRTYDSKKDQAVSDNFYRYLLELNSL